MNQMSIFFLNLNNKYVERKTNCQNQIYWLGVVDWFIIKHHQIKNQNTKCWGENQTVKL